MGQNMKRIQLHHFALARVPDGLETPSAGARTACPSVSKRFRQTNVRTKLSALLLRGALAGLLLLPAWLHGQNFSIDWFTIDGGCSVLDWESALQAPHTMI